MTQRAAFENGCKGKRQYRRRGAAKRALRIRQTTNAGTSHELEPYRCTFCGFYHLGHSTKRGA